MHVCVLAQFRNLADVSMTCVAHLEVSGGTVTGYFDNKANLYAHVHVQTH